MQNGVLTNSVKEVNEYLFRYILLSVPENMRPLPLCLNIVYVKSNMVFLNQFNSYILKELVFSMFISKKRKP